MLARGGDGVEQNLLRILQRLGGLDFGERRLNVLVLGVKSFLLPHLVEIMFERLNEQIVLRLGMWRVQFFHEDGEAFHLGERLDVRHGRLNVVKKIMEHRMFGA